MGKILDHVLGPFASELDPYSHFCSVEVGDSAGLPFYDFFLGDRNASGATSMATLAAFNGSYSELVFYEAARTVFSEYRAGADAAAAAEQLSL